MNTKGRIQNTTSSRLGKKNEYILMQKRQERKAVNLLICNPDHHFL